MCDEMINIDTTTKSVKERFNYVQGGKQGNDCGKDVWSLNQVSLEGPHTVTECGNFSYTVYLLFNDNDMYGTGLAFYAQGWTPVNSGTPAVPSGAKPVVMNGKTYGLFFYGCKPYFNTIANLVTLLVTLPLAIVFIIWMRGQYYEILQMEHDTHFQGFPEVPVRFNDGCRATEAEKNGEKLTDEEYEKRVGEALKLDKHKWMRLQFFFHPVLAVFFAPRRDGFTGSRRGVVMLVAYGCGLTVNCLLFVMLSTSVTGVGAAVVAQFMTMFISLIAEKPITFLIKCSGRMGEGCCASIARCCVVPSVFVLSLLPVVMLIVFGIKLSPQGAFGAVVLAWGASIGTAFWSGLIVSTIMWVLPKFGNAAASIVAINEIYREYEVSVERDPPRKKRDSILGGEDIMTWTEQQKAGLAMTNKDGARLGGGAAPAPAATSAQAQVVIEMQAAGAAPAANFQPATKNYLGGPY